jgi:F420-dependent methylenetetrahydromethanopterin dehydrogenase
MIINAIEMNQEQSSKLNRRNKHANEMKVKNTMEVFKVAENVTEIDVKQMAVLLDHDVVVVAIANAQHIGRHTVACTGGCKVLHHHLHRICSPYRMRESKQASQKRKERKKNKGKKERKRQKKKEITNK